VYPTPSTSIALIGTSSMCGPSRRIWPLMIAAATTVPRLHQFNPTTDTYAGTTPVTSIWPGAAYVDVLGLDEDELCQVLAVDPLTLLSGQIEHSAELPILLSLLDESEQRAGAAVLRRWVRAGRTVRCY